MKIVKKETRVDRIGRDVRINRSVHHCVRTFGEIVKDYIRCFKTPALGYLNRVRASEDS